MAFPVTHAVKGRMSIVIYLAAILMVFVAPVPAYARYAAVAAW